MKFRSSLARKYGSAYFRWNIGYTLAAAVMTVGAIAFAITQAPNWSGLHTLVVLAFAGLNGLFMYLMPAPTPKGQKIRTEIEGFRLYLETAEKLQMNAVKVGSDAPPPMSLERYERFLPYAVALDVEKPWTNIRRTSCQLRQRTMPRMGPVWQSLLPEWSAHERCHHVQHEHRCFQFPATELQLFRQRRGRLVWWWRRWRRRWRLVGCYCSARGTKMTFHGQCFLAIA